MGLLRVSRQRVSPAQQPSRDLDLREAGERTRPGIANIPWHLSLQLTDPIPYNPSPPVFSPFFLTSSAHHFLSSSHRKSRSFPYSRLPPKPQQETKERGVTARQASRHYPCPRTPSAAEQSRLRPLDHAQRTIITADDRLHVKKNKSHLIDEDDAGLTRGTRSRTSQTSKTLATQQNNNNSKGTNTPNLLLPNFDFSCFLSPPGTTNLTQPLVYLSYLAPWPGSTSQSSQFLRPRSPEQSAGTICGAALFDPNPLSPYIRSMNQPTLSQPLSCPRHRRRRRALSPRPGPLPSCTKSPIARIMRR